MTERKGRTDHREILSPTPESVSKFTAKLIENVEVSKLFNINKFSISGSIVKFPFLKHSELPLLYRSEVATFGDIMKFPPEHSQQYILQEQLYDKKEECNLYSVAAN